jgi:hypothetical protein
LKSLRVIIDDEFREFYPEYLVAKKKKKKKIEIVEDKKKSTLSSSGALSASSTSASGGEVKSEEKKKKKKKKEKKQKIETNGEISWKSVEDSTILNTFDHYGKNWSLVSEKVSHSMYPTTSPRNPKNCENRFDVIKNQPKTDLQNEISIHKQMNLNEISKIWEIKTVKEIKPKVVNETFDQKKITVSTPIDYLLKLVNIQKIDEKLPPRLATMQQQQTTPVLNNPVTNVLMVNPTSGNTSPRMQPNSLQIQLPNQKLSPTLNQNQKLSPSVQKYSHSIVPTPNPKISPNSLITNPQQMIEHQNIQIGKKPEPSSSKPIPISRQIQKNVSPQMSPQLNQQPQQPITQNFMFYPSTKVKRESDNVNNSQKKKRLKKE